MNVEFFGAAVLIALVFYITFQVYTPLGLLDTSFEQTVFGGMFVLGALIVVVMVVKPYFFPSSQQNNRY